MIMMFCLGAKISAHVFLDLNETILTQLTSFGFQLAIMRIIRDIVKLIHKKGSSVTLLHANACLL